MATKLRIREGGVESEQVRSVLLTQVSQNRFITTLGPRNPGDSHRSILDLGEVGPVGPTERLEELSEPDGAEASECEGVGLRLAFTIVGLSEARAPAREGASPMGCRA